MPMPYEQLKKALKSAPLVAPLLHECRRVAKSLADELNRRKILRKSRQLFKRGRIDEHSDRIRPDTGIAGVAWVSSWNSRCGVAEYSRFLLDALDTKGMDIMIYAGYLERIRQPDAENVVRCWGSCATGGILPLVEAIARQQPAVAVIQFQFAFFELKGFGLLLDILRKNRIRTIVIFHSTEGDENHRLEWVRESLAGAGALLVHSERDYERLRRMGLHDNLRIFPHGIVVRPLLSLDEAKSRKGLKGKIVIATSGFLMRPKGIENLIEAFALLSRDDDRLHLLLVNALHVLEVSRQLKEQCVERIKALGLEARITFLTDFLPDEESRSYLECADLIVYPYLHTRESSSASVRMGLSTHRPVACTVLDIFNDVKDVVHFLPGSSAEELRRGIRALLDDPRKLAALSEAQEQWIHEHDWNIVGKLLSRIIFEQ